MNVVPTEYATISVQMINVIIASEDLLEMSVHQKIAQFLVKNVIQRLENVLVDVLNAKNALIMNVFPNVLPIAKYAMEKLAHVQVIAQLVKLVLLILLAIPVVYLK
jgi:hypothetical protein